MNKFYYDLHIHSCLSPCGDNDSTPSSIVGMGKLNGLDIMALTDHNTTKNCPAFFKAADEYSVTAVAGMELTTSEDIHMVCLFESLEAAMSFDKEIEKRRIPYKNKPQIFGEQLIMDENDNIIGTEENLLINATTLSLEEAKKLCEEFSGVCYPAHIDRESNGIIAVLGALPDEPKFKVAELHDNGRKEEFTSTTYLEDKNFIVSSDAHYLWDIKERTDYLMLKGNTPDEIRKSLFEFLRGGE